MTDPLANLCKADLNAMLPKPLSPSQLWQDFGASQATIGKQPSARRSLRTTLQVCCKRALKPELLTRNIVYLQMVKWRTRQDSNL